MRNSAVTALFVVVAVVVIAGCGSAPPKPEAAAAAPLLVTKPPSTAASNAPKSLYERLGGKPAIEAVIDQFIANVGADDRINHRFVYTDFPKLRGHLVDQVCAATGGPCTYKGGDMKSVHENQRIDEAAWTALVEDLIAALDELKVPAQEKGELIGALATMHNDIVTVAP
jgi:hemoglobin